MISVSLARRLRDGGLRWEPARGDRFVVADRDMDDEVFAVSDMTIELRGAPQDRVIGFNGTVEWALDSVRQPETVWLPGESQLRELLAGTFRRLERDGEVWAVEIEVGGEPMRMSHESATEAYGLALLYLITGDIPADLA